MFQGLDLEKCQILAFCVFVLNNFILIKPVSPQWLYMVHLDLRNVKNALQDFYLIKIFSEYFRATAKSLETILHLQILTTYTHSHELNFKSKWFLFQYLQETAKKVLVSLWPQHILQKEGFSWGKGLECPRETNWKKCTKI